jgi:hypothetical protein
MTTIYEILTIVEYQIIAAMVFGGFIGASITSLAIFLIEKFIIK